MTGLGTRGLLTAFVRYFFHPPLIPLHLKGPRVGTFGSDYQQGTGKHRNKAVCHAYKRPTTDSNRRCHVIDHEGRHTENPVEYKRHAECLYFPCPGFSSIGASPSKPLQRPAFKISAAFQHPRRQSPRRKLGIISFFQDGEVTRWWRRVRILSRLLCSAKFVGIDIRLN